ncbi:MAG: hypothetical protein Tsb002_03560 [Wenzhouxiangellaceae bacterium]
MKSRYRRNASSRPKLLAYAIGIALSVGGLGYAALSAFGKPLPDALGCYSAALQAQRIVFIDASEPRWNSQQAQAMHSYMDQLWRDLAFNERLSVYTTESEVNHSIIRPRFEVCGQATDPLELEAIGAQSATPGYLHKQKQRLYAQKLLPQMAAILSTAPSEERRQRRESPLFEVLQDISKTLRQGARITVFSDQIQNSEAAQFCQVANDLPTFANFTKRPEYQLVKPRDFRNASIELLLIQRDGYGQQQLEHCSGEAELVRFWRDYYQGNGAAEVFVTRIRRGFTE